MIPRRIWINLAAFLALFGVLCLWAVRNVIKLDVIEQPYRITATFESSPGLRANVEVTYLGVSVGSIQGLHLDGEGVVVELDINKGTRLPEGLTAAVRRKSAVGEPYVALEPPDGYTGDGSIIDPSSEYAIPVSRTSVPLAYGELFTSLDQLISAVDPDDFTIVVHELAVALGGRGPELRRVLANVDDATSTLAARSEVFDALATDLTQLTSTIASGADSIGASFADVAAFVDTLAANRASVDALLTEAPAFGEQVASLLDASVANLGCTASDLGPVFASLGTDAHLADLRALLDAAGLARDALDSALVEPGEDGADGPYLGGSFVPDLGIDPPPVYSPNPTLPSPPALGACEGGGPPAAGSAGEAGASGGSGAAAPTPGASPSVPSRPEVVAPVVPPSSSVPGDDDTFPLMFTLAVLAVGAVVVLFATLRPWRLVRRRDSDL